MCPLQKRTGTAESSRHSLRRRCKGRWGDTSVIPWFDHHHPGSSLLDQRKVDAPEIDVENGGQ